MKAAAKVVVDCEIEECPNSIEIEAPLVDLDDPFMMAVDGPMIRARLMNKGWHPITRRRKRIWVCAAHPKDNR